MQWQENHTVLKFFRNFAVRCFVQMVCENFATAHSLIPLAVRLNEKTDYDI